MARARLCLALTFVTMLAALVASPWPVAGQTPPPATSEVTIVAEPMMGGVVRLGSWAPFRVRVENNGPAIKGDLSVNGAQIGSSTFSREIELATGARQEHILYAPAQLLGGDRYNVTFSLDGTVVASAEVRLRSQRQAGLAVYVVAEHPERLVPILSDVAEAAGPEAPAVVSMTPEDLPQRIEPWSSMDVLVWQDAVSERLDDQQRQSLQTWVAMGGGLVVIAGAAGTSAITGLPPSLLPYLPDRTIDVPVADLAPLFGALPTEAAPLPALTGPLAIGQMLAQSGDDVVAARAKVGSGSVTLIGVDISAPSLAGASTSDRLWSGVAPAAGEGLDQSGQLDDSYIVDALGNLPAVSLFSFDQLLLLVVAYVVAIGPLNYLVLRRRDRREWAWITMPVTIGAFTLAAYILGSAGRGANVVVNELAVVHGATGAERGIAQSYIGVFSPSRAELSVRVHGDPLLFPPNQQGRFGVEPAASGTLDVQLGDPAVIRRFGVGYGSLRAFRAQAQLTTPRVDTDLRLVGDQVEGTVTNSSGETLSAVSVMYSGSVTTLGDMAPGESRPVQFRAAGGGNLRRLADRLFPDFGEGRDQIRSIAARRALLQHLTGGWDDFGGEQLGVLGGGPLVLAWSSGGTLGIDVEGGADHVGERLYLLAARLSIVGPVSFSGSTISHTTESIDAIEGQDTGQVFTLGRGTVAAEYWPAGVDGRFSVTRLLLSLRETSPSAPSTATTVELRPLPDAEQPASDGPLASDPRPGDALGAPRIQLFDRALGVWVEFEPAGYGDSVEIVSPERYVDEAGAFRARFVVRGFNDYVQVALGVRLQGTIE